MYQYFSAMKTLSKILLIVYEEECYVPVLLNISTTLEALSFTIPIAIATVNILEYCIKNYFCG